MNPELIFIAIAVIGTFGALLTDLHNRWVPDWLNYSLITIGLAGHLILSLTKGSIMPFAMSLAAFVIFYLIGFLCLYAGVFGGGDAKLLAGLSALLATSTGVVKIGAPWPFMMTLVLNILLVGSVIGVLFLVWIILKNSQKLSANLKQVYSEKKFWILAFAASIILPITASIINSKLIFTIPLWAMLFLAVLLLIGSKTIETITLTKKIKPSQLIEGDWLVDPVKIGGKLIYKPKIAGIEQEDINKLISLEKQGKLSSIEVKDGVPYVLAIFFGLIISLFFGDLMILILRGVLNG